MDFIVPYWLLLAFHCCLSDDNVEIDLMKLHCHLFMCKTVVSFVHVDAELFVDVHFGTDLMRKAREMIVREK